MDSDNTSNPSSKAGDADDLIEEMAKLMGNPSPSRSSESETSTKASQSSSGPRPEGPSSDARNSGEGTQSRPAPEPVAVPRDTPASSNASGNTPGWLPQNRRPAAPDPAPAPKAPQPESHSESGSDERKEPSFALRPPSRPAVDEHEPEVTPEPARAESWRPQRPAEPARAEFDFGLKRETPRSPEPAPPPAPTATAQSPHDFDFGFGPSAPKASAEPEAARPGPQQPAGSAADSDVEDDDPIAALIRDQLDHPKPAEERAPEPVPNPLPPSQPAQTRQRPDSNSDNFTVPPVFGLGGDSGKRSMGGSDALDDIENLIGSAVRVDLPAQERQPQERQPQARVEPAPVPQPAVRPHQPRQAQPQPAPESDVDEAEAAILAAMASNSRGANEPRARQPEQPAAVAVDYGQPPPDDVLTDNDSQESRGGIRWGRVLVPVAALLLLGAIGYGGYMFLTATPPEGETPVLTADADPNKVTPEPEAPAETDDAIVFTGDQEADGAEEQLVSRDQSQDPANNPVTPAGDDAIRQIITADTTENGLANRRVRTVTVRPDGTIVRGDDQVAGTEALPVERPDVPALPEDAVTSPLANTEVAGLSLDEPVADPAASLTSADPANLVAVNGTSVPFPVSRPDDLAALRAAVPAQSTPVIVTQPTNTQPAVTATPPQQTAPQQSGTVDLLGDLEAVTPSPEPPATVPSAADPPGQPVTAAAWVQLASQRDQAIANSEAGRLSRLYSSALGGRQPVVQRADLADRGIWYRVMVPAGSLSEAQTICSQITSIGGDCFARAN